MPLVLFLNIRTIINIRCLYVFLPLWLSAADAREQAAHAEGFLLVQLLQGPLQVLHQPARGDAAFPPEPRRVRHRPLHVRATPGGGVHPAGLL